MAKKKKQTQSKLKHWLIPGEHNNHKPHIVKLRWSALIVMFLIAMQLAYNFGTTGKFKILGYATNINSGGVASLVNSQRAANGLGSLSYNGALSSAAAAKANDMLAKGYWAHYSPSGVGPAYFIGASGYSYSVAGENLAKNWQSNSGVVNAWMASSSHRANVLGDYSDIGVATVNGVLNGQETTLVVAMFGKRPGATAPAPAPASKPAASAPAPAPKPASSAPAASSSNSNSSAGTAQNADQPAQTEETPAASTDATQQATAEQTSTEESAAPAATTDNNFEATKPSLASRLKLMAIASWPAVLAFVTLSAIGILSLISHHKQWLAHIKRTGRWWAPKIHIPQLLQFSIILLSLLATAAFASFGSVL